MQKTSSKLEGIIIKVFGNYFYVQSIIDSTFTQKTIKCTLRGRLKKEFKNTRNIGVVGDQCIFTILKDVKNKDELNEGVIEEIRDRKNKISRSRITATGIKESIIAANIDYFFIVNSFVKPTLKTGFIDRLLIIAEKEEIPACIIINKADLVNENDFNDVIAVYQKLGYNILITSAKTNQGITTFKQLLKDKTSILSGYSGVGKSTLINLLLNKAQQTTADISSSSQKGKHTTTNVEMIPLPFNGYIIDTPGLREFGLFDIAHYHLSDFFIEMREISSQCEYKQCSHTHEPGCAVKHAVEEGEIAQFRYENYVRILENPN